MSNTDSGTHPLKPFSFNEDEILVSLIECKIDGTLETGRPFYGKLVAFNDKLLLLEGNYKKRIMIRRKTVVRLEAA